MQNRENTMTLLHRGIQGKLDPCLKTDINIQYSLTIDTVYKDR